MAKVDKPHQPWLAGDVRQLEDLAAFGMAPDEIGHVLGRTGKAITEKAAEVGVAINSRPLSTIRNFGRKGGVFTRTFMPGIGWVWRTAHRSGGGFPADACERLLDAGMIVPAERAGEGGHLWWKQRKPRKAKIGS